MDFKTEKVSISSRLCQLAREKPEKPAFIFRDKFLKRTVLTRHDVWDKTRKCAAFFRRQGIVKGDVVCNTLVNSQERLITTYGIIVAGAVAMHGQKFLADGEDIVKNWEDSQCKAVIINPNEEKGAGDVLEKIKYTDGKTGKVGYKGLPYLSHVIPINLGDNDERSGSGWLQLLEQETEMYVDETVGEDDLAMINTTSGSTGFAKLVPHTQRTLAAIGDCIKTLLNLKHDSLYFNDRSLGWVGGIPIAYLHIGLTRILVDHTSGREEDTGNFLFHIFEHEMCDTGIILPSGIQSLLDYLDSIEKHTLVKLLPVVGTGGGPVSKTTMKAIGRISESVTVLYGASEFGIGFGCHVSAVDSDYENACCGFAAGQIEVKIVDEDLEKVPPGKSGEVLVRGPSLISGYLNNPQVNKEVFLSGGWWRTSDIGHLDEEGQLFVYCRKSFAINHKGFIHYPGWMEIRINKHPEIKKSIVVGIPDPVDYEQICLCVIKTPESTLTLTPEGINEICKSLFLTSATDDITPIPKYYLFFDAFPLNSNGKVDKKAIKELALKRVEAEYRQ